MLKVTKNQGFTRSLKDTFLEKPQENVKLTPDTYPSPSPPPPHLSRSLFKVKRMVFLPLDSLAHKIAAITIWLFVL